MRVLKSELLVAGQDDLGGVLQDLPARGILPFCCASAASGAARRIPVMALRNVRRCTTPPLADRIV